MSNPRVLYVSGSFGLGHATRDLAIVRELRRKAPLIEVAWLSASPTSEFLVQAGETLVPECLDYSSETDSAEAIGAGGRLNLTAYVYSALAKWLHNARVIGRACRRGGFDLIVGDETYEVVVSYVLGLRTVPGVPYIMLYDFWGVDIATGSLLERLGAWGLNLIWSRERSFTGRRHNAALFIGEPADIRDERFGRFLPNRLRRVEGHLDFLGYILPFDSGSLPLKSALRSELGYGPEPLVICTVGGTSVGRELLDLCGQAYPAASDLLPGLKMVLVCGPRLDPGRIDVPEGVEKRGMVPDLYRHLACADLVVTQGGGTTTVELTALRVPFLFFPVLAQAEQEVTIANRLARHGAGIRMTLAETSPASLARAIAGNIGIPATYPMIPCQGAVRAAEIIVERLSRLKH